MCMRTGHSHTQTQYPQRHRKRARANGHTGHTIGTMLKMVLKKRPLDNQPTDPPKRATPDRGEGGKVTAVGYIGSFLFCVGLSSILFTIPFNDSRNLLARAQPCQPAAALRVRARPLGQAVPCCLPCLWPCPAGPVRACAGRLS